MTKQPEIKDLHSNHVFTVDEVEPGTFQSVFPERLSEESSLHPNADEAWAWINEVIARDAHDNSQFGVGA
jgi:hypothetical protein